MAICSVSDIKNVPSLQNWHARVAWLWLYMGSRQHLFLSLQRTASKTEWLWNDCWNTHSGFLLIKIRNSFQNSKALPKFSKCFRVILSPAAIFKYALRFDTGFEPFIVFMPCFPSCMEKSEMIPAHHLGIKRKAPYIIHRGLCSQVNLLWIPKVFALL